MCWTTKYAHYGKPKFAEQDTKVFKVCLKDVATNSINPYYHYVHMKYEVGKSYDLAGRHIAPWEGFGRDVIYIEYGFHSYNSETCSYHHPTLCLPQETDCKSKSFIVEHRDGTEKLYDKPAGYVPVIVECSIPKNTIYYENERGEIVSEHLKIEKICVG